MTSPPRTSVADSPGDGAVDATVDPTGGTSSAAQGDSVDGAIGDEDLAELVNVEAGDQVQDRVGNLIVVYGITAWPAGFEVLSPDARAAFPFVAAIDPGVVVDHDLYAFDVGMCAAGVDADAGGTVDFFAHGDGDEPLAAPDSADRAVFGTEPVLLPGFAFPSAATCARGWIPVYWDRPEPPGTVRYVLTVTGAGGAIERSVYQWHVTEAAVDEPPAGAAPFGIAQTVTFNSGLLQGTTIVVDGWTELADTSVAIAGTRMVGVSLTVCPAGPDWPVFGLVLDGWNLSLPLDPGDHLGAEAPAATGCFDGWLEFVVPNGTTPTGFTASDGVDFVKGFADWSLDGAALATPR